MQPETARDLLYYLIEVAKNRRDREDRGANTKRGAAYDSRISTILDKDSTCTSEDRIKWVKLARLVYFSEPTEDELNLPIIRVNPQDYVEFD